MRTRLPADLQPGDKVAVEGGGYVVVSRTENVQVEVSGVQFPAVRVHWDGGMVGQVADPRVPVELAP